MRSAKSLQAERHFVQLRMGEAEMGFPPKRLPNIAQSCNALSPHPRREQLIFRNGQFLADAGSQHSVVGSDRRPWIELARKILNLTQVRNSAQ